MRSLRGELSIFSGFRRDQIQATLEVKNLTLKFGGNTALNKVSLTVDAGELLAVIGPNGAGKTSLLNCMTGTRKPQEGRILFNGREIAGRAPHRNARDGMAICREAGLLPDMDVLTNLLLARHCRLRYGLGRAFLFTRSVKEEEGAHRLAVEEIIDFFDMQPVRKRPVRELGREMRKRAGIACALASEPKILLLDEPFSGIASKERDSLVQRLSELNERYGQTMILVEQDMSAAMEIASRIIALDYGTKIAEGSPDFIQNHPHVVKAYRGLKSAAG